MLLVNKKASTKRVKAGKAQKVHYNQWRTWNSTFREGYEIDLSAYNPGDIVRCPKCGGPVDFKLFPASRLPRLQQVDNENQEPETDQPTDT